MGNVFIILGIVLMVFACAAFIAGHILLGKKRQELEEYLYDTYGKGEDACEMPKL